MRDPRDELVSWKALDTLIDTTVDLRPYRPYMEKRWAGMVMWWHNRSVNAKRSYVRLRLAVVAGGVAIPVLSTLSLINGWHTWLAVSTAVVGAAVAASAAWEGVQNYGETWREKRKAAELLKVEGWQFIELCGKYESYRTRRKDRTLDRPKSFELAFPRFVAEVEGMIGGEVGQYLALFDDALDQARKQAAEANTGIGGRLKGLSKPEP